MYAIIILLFILFVVYRAFPLVEVKGNSMYPTYNDGDILISLRLPFFTRFKIGSVYVYKPPYESDEMKYVIKRLHKFNEKGYLYFLGDNLAYSQDSRNYGYIERERVVCKILFRIKRGV